MVDLFGLKAKKEVEKLKDKLKRIDKRQLKRKQFEDQILVLKHEISRLKSFYPEREQTLKIINEEVDLFPKGSKERGDTVAMWAGYYQSGLTKKVKNFIASFKHQLTKFPLTEKEGEYYRACVNVSYLLLEFGEGMVSEHNANIKAQSKEEENIFDIKDEEGVENIKKAVG